MNLKLILPVILFIFSLGCTPADRIGLFPGYDESIIKDGVNSTILGDTYDLYIRLPHGYHGGSETYNVIYLLDGDSLFSTVLSIVADLESSNEIPPSILVGIGGGDNRARDYTPTKSDENDDDQTGGAEDFFDSLVSEMIPYIETQYRAEPDREFRTLLGHSYGGLAALYGLFEHSSSFSHFVAASPSLYFDTGVILSYEDGYSQSNGDLNADLFIGNGKTEMPLNCIYIDEIEDRLTGRGYTSLRLNVNFYNITSHSTSYMRIFREGLSFSTLEEVGI